MLIDYKCIAITGKRSTFVTDRKGRRAVTGKQSGNLITNLKQSVMKTKKAKIGQCWTYEGVELITAKTGKEEGVNCYKGCYFREKGLLCGKLPYSCSGTNSNLIFVKI